MLPPEIFHYIVSYINSTESLKSLSLVSKGTYAIVCEKLWSSVILKNADGLKHVCHLPINVLVVRDDKCEDKHLSIISTMSSSLSTLDLSYNCNITSLGLYKLQVLTNLQCLYLCRCDLDDKCLSGSAKLQVCLNWRF